MRMVDTVDGPTVTADRYELRLDSRRLAAAVVGADGRPWFRLRLLASVDTLGGPDETLAVESVSCEPMDDRVRIEVACSSSLWHSRRTYLDCFEDRLELGCEISGHGRISAVHLLGGWRPPNGFLPSGSAARTTFSPNPDHPRRIARPAGEPAVISVAGDGGEPGVGRWIFTPAPWCFAASLDTAPGPEEIPGGEWAGLACWRRSRSRTTRRSTRRTRRFSTSLTSSGSTTR